MGVVTFEMQTKLISNSIKNFLQQEGIDFHLTFPNIHTLQIDNIIYHHQPLASSITITLLYTPLLNGVLYIDKIVIKKLNVKTLTTIKTAKTSSSTPSSHSTSAFFLRPFIKEVFITAMYEPFFARAKLKNLTPQHGTITSLILHTPYGNALAKGSYKNKKLTLYGRLYPKNLPLVVKRSPFIVKIDPQKIKFALKTPKAFFQNINLKHIKIRGKYDYKKLLASATLQASMKQTDAFVNAHISYEKELSYDIDANISNQPYPIPLHYSFYRWFHLQAKGKNQQATILLNNRYCQCNASLHNTSFELSSSILQATDLNASLPKDMWLRIQATGDLLQQHLTIFSNYFNASLQKDQKIDAKVRFSKPFQKFNLPALSPLHIQYDFAKLSFSSPFIKGEFTNKGEGKATLANASITLKKEDNSLLFHLHTPSLKTTLKKVSLLYPVSIPKKDLNFAAKGAINLHKQSLHTTIKAKAKQIDSIFSYFETTINATPKQIVIPYYALVLKDRGFYATKNSIIKKRKDKLLFTLWLEDSIKVQGWYDIKASQAKGSIKAHRYHYSFFEGDLKSDINLSFTFQQPHLDIKGDIKLLQGLIRYQPKKSRAIEDRDIIVIDAPKKEESFFQKNVSLYIKVDSKRPILYKIPGLYILMRPDLLLYKEQQKPLQLLGMLKILRGRYQLEDRIFDILPSSLSFFGPPTNPLLELSLKTTKNNYNIFITIGGDLENPILHFDSEPPLQESEILSLLAFGTTSKSLLGSAMGGSRLGAMLSNLFIKDLIGAFGIQLDTLSLITSSNRLGIEIGKRLSDKITVIYKNDEISTLIIRYQFTPHIISDFVFGPNKSGAHLFYRKIK